MRRGPGEDELPADVRRRSAPERNAALLEAVLDAVPFPTVLLDPDGLMLLGNAAWTERTTTHHGDRFQVGVGKSYYDQSLAVRDDDDSHRLMESLRELARGERTEVSVDHAAATTPGADTRWYHIHASRVDELGHVVVTHVDISSRVAAERQATWRARHDPLTELPNRAHLHDLIEAELRRPSGPPVAVLFLDVDGFKDVNDSLGHEAGDQLLRELAGRLGAVTRGQDTIGRLGGDEFVVLCRDSDADGAEVLAHRCQAVFQQPFQLDGRSVQLGASIGIAGVPGGARIAVRSTDLVRDADLAMYAAKSAGRNRIRVFTSDLRAAVQQKVQLAGELRDAIDQGQLVLHYQPILHLPSHRCSGVEALVRWQHPVRGLLPPSDFVALAEQHDLIAPLTRWVLHTATRQAAAWDAAGLPLVIGVNISADHFAEGTLVDDVATALAAAGLPPERLVIELTETSVAEDPLRAAAQLAELRISGVEVSIDDFGSGFSSLSQLTSLPAGVLKIDRSLVAGADRRGSRSAAAMEAVVALANALGMRSLAEGVETAEQLALAQEIGCSLAQGFFIARPMPADAVTEWLRERTVGVVARPRVTAGTGRTA